jgi:hypothetical protein
MKTTLQTHNYFPDGVKQRIAKSYYGDVTLVRTGPHYNEGTLLETGRGRVLQVKCRPCEDCAQTTCDVHNC